MTEYDPFAEFRDPAWGSRDFFDKWNRFNEVFSSIPIYANASVEARDEVRRRVLGVQDTNQIYSEVLRRVKESGADSRAQSEVFNALAKDDARYQSWGLNDKISFRNKLVGAIDAEQAQAVPNREILGTSSVPGPQIGELTPEGAVQGLTRDLMNQELAAQQAEAAQARELQETSWDAVAPSLMLGAPGDVTGVLMNALGPTEAGKGIYSMAPQVAAAIPETAAAIVDASASAPWTPAATEQTMKEMVAEPLYGMSDTVAAITSLVPAAKVGKIEDIQGLADFGDWIAYQLGQQAMIMPTVLGATAAAGPAGGLGAATLLQTGMESREIRELGKRDPGTAIVVGLVTGAMEYLPMASLLNRMGPAKKGFTDWAAKKLASMGTQAIEEGVTEGLQTFTERLGKAYVDENIEMFSPEALSEYANAMAAGAAVGGPVAAVTPMAPYEAKLSATDKDKITTILAGMADREQGIKTLIAQSPELQAILKESKDAKEAAQRIGRLEVEAEELQRIHKLMTPEELAGQAAQEPEPATSLPSEMFAPPGETPGPTVEEQLAAPPQPRPLDPIVERLRAANMHNAANALDKAQMGEILTPDEVVAVDSVAQAVEGGQVEPETAEAVEKFRAKRLAPLPEVEKKSAYQEVVDAVAGGAETVEDIITAVKTNLTKDEVRQHLNAAMKAGEIDKHQPGNRRPLQYTPAGEMTRTERAAAMTPQEIDDVIVDAVVGSETGLTAAEVRAQLAENVPLDITMQQAAAALRRLTNQDRLTKTREGNAFRYGPPPTEGQKLSEVTENLGRLPGPINAKAADLKVGDTFNMPTMDIEGATVTAIEKGERAQRSITYTTPGGQTETAVVGPRRAVEITRGPEAARVAEIVDKGAKAAEPKKVEEATPEEAPKAPSQKRLADMEEKYRRLIDAAETPAEIDAVAEAWNQEKSKPWRAGIEREMAKKRRQLAAAARKAGAEQTAGAAPATKRERTGRGKKPPSPFQQKVLDSIKRGNTSNTEIHNDTGIPQTRIRSAAKELERRGQITSSDEDTGRAPGQTRKRYALVEEADQRAARKAAAEAAEAAKAEKKAAKEEAAAKPTFEKHKEEFDRILNAERPKPDRTSERGSIELPQTKQEKKSEEETNRSRDEYAKRKIADYAASGGTIVPSEKYLIEFRAKLSRGQRRAYDEMVAMVESYVIEGKHDFQVIEKILKRGSDKRKGNERAALGYALVQYLLGPEQNGLKDLDEVKKLVKDRVSKEDLDELEAIRKRNQERHKQLVESDLLPEQVKERLRTKEFYFRRAYDRYLRSGEWSGRWTPFTPTEEAREAAVDVVQHAFAKEVEKLAVKLHDFHGMVPKGFDFVGFFKTRDDSMLKGIDGELADKLIGLRHQIQYWGDMVEINLAASDDVVGLTAVSNRLRDHAEDMVKIILEDPVTRKRAGSKLSIANLQERTLTEVFRALYGEIKDPAVLQALTVEAQGTLIAQAMFFDDLSRNGRGLVWSDRPTSEYNLTERLGSMDGDVLRQDDVFRYGPLAGKYVDPLFKDFLDNAGVYQVYFSELLDFGTVTTQKLGAIWGKHFAALQGATRTMALTSVGAYTRNLMTSYLQFAMQSGDFFHPEFHGKFWRNINQARKILLNHPDALTVLAEDMRRGKFRYTQTSIVTDMAPVLQTQGSQTVRSSANTLGKLKYGLKGTTGKIKELYILMDYAAKKASFETRYDLAKKKGKSDEVASAYGKWYVETFYQNAEKVPEWINAISKLGLADFVGFKYDSGRMAINSVIMARIAASKKLRAPSPKDSWLADWKGILNEHPDLIDTWQPGVGMAAARLGGIGIFGPGQYLLASGLAQWGVAGGAFITNACMKAFGYDDEDDKITSTDLPHQVLAGLNKLKPIYDANGLGWNYGMIDKDGKKWIRFVPLNSHFGNFFEEWLMGYVQRFNVAKENPREVIEDMIRKNNVADLALGMTWSNLVQLFTGFSPDGTATPNNLWHAIDSKSGLKWTESFNEIGLAILDYAANTTGAFGRAWKKYSREESAAGRTPKPGNFFKSQGVEEDDSFDFFFRFLVPIFRVTRLDDYDANKMMQSAAYKLSPVAEAVAQGKYNWGTMNRAGKEWVEGASVEEQKISEKGREWTKENLRRAEAYVASVKPALEYTGVTDDEMIDLIRSKIPGGTSFSEKEAKAIVLGKVEDYINSKEFIAPDASASPIQRGDATLKELIRKNVPPKTAYDAMLSEHFEVGEYDKFLARYGKTVMEIRRGDPKLGF